MIQKYTYLLIVLLFLMADSLFAQSDTLKNASDTVNEQSENKVLNYLSGLVFREISEKQKTIDNQDNIISEYSDVKGKMVRNIEIVVYKPFGADFDDSILSPSTAGKIGNLSHFNSRTKFIQGFILIDKGDIADPVLLAETEANLRNLNQIRDVRILVSSPDHDSTVVDLKIEVIDKYTIGFDVVKEGKNGINTRIYERNFLGRGINLMCKSYFDPDNDPRLGHKLQIRSNNLTGFFESFELTHENKPDYLSNTLRMDRPYFSYKTRLAGGIYAQQYRTSKWYQNDSLVIKKRLEYDYESIWIGTSRPLISEKYSSNVTFSLLGARKYYHSRPEFDDEIKAAYTNATYLMGNFSFIRKRFIRMEEVFAFGQTEVLNEGIVFSINSGMEIRTNSILPYYGLGITFGKLTANKDYIMLGFSHGGFRHKNIWERMAHNSWFHYISDSKKLGRSKMRHYFNMDLKWGENRLPGEYLTINDRYGIRGFKADSLTGNLRLKLNYETILFTPIEFLGFRMALFSYVDIAGLSQIEDTFWEMTYYAGVGAGVRFRNDKLVFNTFQIRLAYYPVLPPGINNDWHYIMNNIPRYRLPFMQAGKPGIVSY